MSKALTGELQAVREELESWVSYGPRACQLLQQLKSFQVSVEILRSTQLGKILGRYTRHPEACVAASAKKLVEGWKEQLRPRTQAASDDDSDAPRRKRDRRVPQERVENSRRLVRRKVVSATKGREDELQLSFTPKTRRRAAAQLHSEDAKTLHSEDAKTSFNFEDATQRRASRVRASVSEMQRRAAAQQTR
ncbi:unnamed protein product [Effrenium voratum]|uniref:TFIIS N-terminal domain-containing protein n=1 Tax=Effrenium voratum TaxID=2562239 RepID=A0AA36ML20_9DINO|nr:unnamed protein product [Effrenium voratum]